MSKKAFMGWNVVLKRWEKMYKGQRLYVVPKTLNCQPTKDDSLDAANAWFIARRSEIDGAPKPEPTHDDALTTALIALPDAAAALFGDDQEQKEAALGAILEHYQTQRPTRKATVEAKVTRITEEMQRLLDEPGPDLERTVDAQFAAWSRLVMASKKANSTKKMKIHRLTFFVEFLGKSSDASKIDENRWESFFVWLAGKGFEDSHKARIQIDAKNFVKYLFEKRILDTLPRNLGNKALAFGDAVKKIKVVSLADVRTFFEAATGQTRLHVLLGLNCGMTAQDISDLQQSQVDWTLGTITRKRSKTAIHEDVPVVCYKLWPETFDLLKNYRSDVDSVLVTKTGKPWIQSAYDGGEDYKHSDSIGSCFKNVCAKTGLSLTPKNLRTVASNHLGTHPQYKFYAQYFLGQSPKTVADKHYVKPNDAEFFKALDWLRPELLG
jgi:integrase